MKARTVTDATEAKPAQERLISAVIDAWEETGGRGISARQLCQIAEVQPSAIYHHFGSMEQLLVAAQESARDRAARWCEAILADLEGVEMGADGFAAALAATVDAWAHDQRRLAFAWREGQLLGMRDPAFQGAVEHWRSLWSGFWPRFCGHFGLAHGATLTARWFESEGLLHMFRWRRIIDRAGLDEFCRGWSAWLTGAPTPTAPSRDFARAAALAAPPPLPDRDETTLRLADAGVDLVARSGVGALTHRAVAAEAGMRPGVAFHKFQTSADLLRAVYERIYSGNIASGDETASLDQDRDAILDTLARNLQRSTTRLSAQELFVATARDADLEAFAVQLRYLRGRNSGRRLATLLNGARPVKPLDEALFSAVIAGQVRSHIGRPEEEARRQIREELEQLLGLLD